MARIHNELSAVTVTARAFDTDGDAFVPTTARYRVDDCRSEEELIGWTDLTVSLAMEITIPGSVNAIINDERQTPEPKVITVNTDLALDTQHYEEYIYRVRNLSFAQEA